VCSCDLHLSITVNQKWGFEFLSNLQSSSSNWAFFVVFLRQNVVHWGGFFLSVTATIVALQFCLNHYFQMRDGKDKVLINLNAERKHCLKSDCRSED